MAILLIVDELAERGLVQIGQYIVQCGGICLARGKRSAVNLTKRANLRGSVFFANRAALIPMVGAHGGFSLFNFFIFRSMHAKLHYPQFELSAGSAAVRKCGLDVA